MWPKCGSHPFSLGHVWANTERSTITHCLGSFLLPPPFSHLSAVSMLKCFVTIMSSPLWRMGPLWRPPFKKQLWDQTALLWLQWSWVMVVIKLRWTAAGFSLIGKPLTLDSSYSAYEQKAPNLDYTSSSPHFITLLRFETQSPTLQTTGSQQRGRKYDLPLVLEVFFFCLPAALGAA